MWSLVLICFCLHIEVSENSASVAVPPCTWHTTMVLMTYNLPPCTRTDAPKPETASCIESHQCRCSHAMIWQPLGVWPCLLTLPDSYLGTSLCVKHTPGPYLSLDCCRRVFTCLDRKFRETQLCLLNLFHGISWSVHRRALVLCQSSSSSVIHHS